MLFRCLLITLIAVTLIPSIQATPVYTRGIEGQAYICPEDGVYPNYHNCTTFITCSNGLQYVMSCPEGLIWNVNTNECDWPYNTECVSYPREFNDGP
ncbi:probable endochitinase [Daphnia carinata]|uniref:probable endochitinase n=1 Tax=Daphnia carinata TaxID=120202 RepID=UPI002580E695|nr:probable endochitinase [Daphnia carinata]